MASAETVLKPKRNDREEGKNTTYLLSDAAAMGKRCELRKPSSDPSSLSLVLRMIIDNHRPLLHYSGSGGCTELDGNAPNGAFPAPTKRAGPERWRGVLPRHPSAFLFLFAKSRIRLVAAHSAAMTQRGHFSPPFPQPTLRATITLVRGSPKRRRGAHSGVDHHKRRPMAIVQRAARSATRVSTLCARCFPWGASRHRYQEFAFSPWLSCHGEGLPAAGTLPRREKEVEDERRVVRRGGDESPGDSAAGFGLSRVARNLFMKGEARRGRS
ncbi:hypothetical protein BC628DRAFT_1493885 [Trametes gibbosa]|nr:hypothetical protein BC628DRAFT_1493885 [Trametes gibbosa]